MKFFDFVSRLSAKIIKASIYFMLAVVFFVAALGVAGWALGAFDGKAKSEGRREVDEVVSMSGQCECGSGVICEGARGGKYCTDGGKKRYR